MVKDTRIVICLNNGAKDFFDFLEKESRHSKSEIGRAMMLWPVVDIFQTCDVNFDVKRFDDKIGDLLRMGEWPVIERTFNEVINRNKFNKEEKINA